MLGVLGRLMANSSVLGKVVYFHSASLFHRSNLIYSELNAKGGGGVRRGEGGDWGNPVMNNNFMMGTSTLQVI